MMLCAIAVVSRWHWLRKTCCASVIVQEDCRLLAIQTDKNPLLSVRLLHGAAWPGRDQELLVYELPSGFTLRCEALRMFLQAEQEIQVRMGL